MVFLILKEEATKKNYFKKYVTKKKENKTIEKDTEQQWIYVPNPYPKSFPWDFSFSLSFSLSLSLSLSYLFVPLYVWMNGATQLPWRNGKKISNKKLCDKTSGIP